MAVELIESSKRGSRMAIEFCIGDEELAEKKAANHLSFLIIIEIK